MKIKNLLKKNRLFIVFILFGCIAFLCSQRWDVWFGNPIEPPYLSRNFPERIQLTLGNEGQFSRNVSWQCGDTLATSNLFISKKETSDTTAIEAAGKLLHTQGGTTVTYHAKLTDLKAGEYFYSVSTGGKQSDWYNFKVSTNDRFTFVYIGDIQDTIGGNAGNMFSKINRNNKDAAFWILGGDVIERPHDQYWNEYYTSMDSISQTMPVLACPGNHEYYKGLCNKLDERFIYNFPYFVYSRNEGYAVFNTNYQNVAIITLDSHHGFWTLFSQRRWFKNTLDKMYDVKWKIVVLHHPVYSVRGKLKHFFIRCLFNSLIRKYGVDIVLQGHEHCYARKITKDNNNTLVTPVYIISQSSPKNYKINPNSSYDRLENGMRFYQTIEICTDTLTLKTYTETENLYDQVRIIKNDCKLLVTATK